MGAGTGSKLGLVLQLERSFMEVERLLFLEVIALVVRLLRLFLRLGFYFLKLAMNMDLIWVPMQRIQAKISIMCLQLDG